jgi:SAM-dependent methyltransferase
MNRHEFNQYLNHLNHYHSTILNTTLKKSGNIRSYYANKYLSGDGIEIGAESNPLFVNKRNINIKYVDRLTPEETSKIYNIPFEYIVKPHYLSEAHNLNIFSNKSFDFVIANHLIEHVVDPIGAIIEWLRVLKNDGILFLTVPNFRGNEYDFCRKPVKISHLIDDYHNSHLDLKIEHWKEFIEIVEGINPSEPSFFQRLQLFKEIDFRIHMHVFDKRLIVDLLKFLLSIGERIRIIDSFFFTYGFEILLIIKKCQNSGTKLSFRNKIRNLILLKSSV